MIGYRPPRPVGSSPEAMFMQAVWDKLWGAAASETRVNDISGARTHRTTRGTIVIQPTVRGSSSDGGSICPTN
jgi:hypothetical protein